MNQKKQLKRFRKLIQLAIDNQNFDAVENLREARKALFPNYNTKALVDSLTLLSPEHMQGYITKYGNENIFLVRDILGETPPTSEG